MRLAKFVAVLAAAASLLVTDMRADVESPATPLTAAMEQVGKSFKILSRGLRTPDPAKSDTYQAAARTLEENLKKAKGHVPPIIAALPSAQQPAPLAAYGDLMAKSIAKAEELSAVLQAGDFEAATALVRELKILRNDSHEQFQEDEE